MLAACVALTAYAACGTDGGSSTVLDMGPEGGVGSGLDAGFDAGDSLIGADAHPGMADDATTRLGRDDASSGSSLLDAGAGRADADAPRADAKADGAMTSSVPLTPLVGGDGVALSFRVVDAEYSHSLDRVVLVAGHPNRLVVLDGESGSFVDAPLLRTPTSVSVAPDGRSAAVGHNGQLSLFDLAPLSLRSTLNVAADVGDVVLAGNGYVYVLPRSAQWESLFSVEVASARETITGGVYSGTVARLHPAGDRMYGADRGISPDDIERYDIVQGAATVAYDSPYHGQYPMCGGLWFSDDGARIFTACGHVFRASHVRADDMTYERALEGGPHVRWLDHSPTARLLAVVHGSAFAPPSVPNASTTRDVSVFDDRALTFRARASLPKFEVGGKQYAGEGRFVFFNAQSTRLYVLIEAEASAPTVHDFGLARFGVDADAGVLLAPR